MVYLERSLYLFLPFNNNSSSPEEIDNIITSLTNMISDSQEEK